MIRLFLHAATRVIRRATTDMTMPPLDDEITVDLVDESFDLRVGGKYWKLDVNNQRVEATEQEIDDADVDDEKVGRKRANKRRALDNAVNAIATAQEPTMAQVKAYFVALRNLR